MITKEFSKWLYPHLYTFIEEDLSDVLGMMSEHSNEIEFIRQCLRKIDIDASHPICFAMWRKYSLQSSAGWLNCENESEVLTEAKRILKPTA